MSKKDFKSNTTLNVTLEKDKYTIVVPVKNKLLSGLDEYYFTLKRRDGKDKIYLNTSIKNSTDKFSVFNLVFSFNEYKHMFLKDDIFDLYISLKKDDEIKKTRIKSAQTNLRILAIVLSDREETFYPYTTKNGNLSFRLNNYYLFAAFEEVHITKREINFSGYFIYSPMLHSDDYKIINKKLIITNNIDESEIEMPLEGIYRPDLFENYNGNKLLKETGYKGTFNFMEDPVTKQKRYYKFHLDLTYEKNGVIETVRSTRMRYNMEGKGSQRKIIRIENKKLRVKVIPTRKSRYLSLQVYEYNFKDEIIRNTKSRWVKFRRSDFVHRIYQGVFYVLGKLLPARKNLIIFESFLGKQYSDSPRAIYEYMIENDLDYDMYWSVDRGHIKNFKNREVKYVRRFSIKWLLLMTRANYWVTNSRLPLWIPKPRDTIYLQTWHGTPLKRLAADMEEVHMPGTNTVRYKENFLKEASNWDYLVSPNAYSTEIFQRAFQFDKIMIESGYPRNDFLLNFNDEVTSRQIKKASRLPLDKKIILYAPTWRDNQFYERGKYKFDLQMDLARMKEELGEEYIIVLRLHYLIAENIKLTDYEGFVYDFSYHEDIRELYIIADLLITDYSSVFFDYANLKRPMLFYVYDIEDYRDNIRGFYFDFEAKAPGPLVKTTEEIISEVNKIDENGFKPSVDIQAFYKRFCYLEDGNATKRVVEKVFKD